MPRQLRHRFILIAILVFLEACGPAVETDEDASNIPGGDLKSLDRKEATRFQNINGALGDVFHFVEHRPRSESSETVNLVVDGRPIISRKVFRDQLKNSVDFQNCHLAQTGSQDKDFQATIGGDDCNIRTLFLRERRENEEESESEITISEEKTFYAKDKGVETDIAFMNLVTQFEKTEREWRGKHRTYEQVTSRVRGESQGFGTFDYTLRVRYQSQRPSITNEEADTKEFYRRTDEVSFHKGFKAVLYHKVIKENLEIKEDVYYLNGEPIGKGYYFRLLQDIDQQAGLENI